MPKVIAIDPPGCGCTECIIGEYVPLESANDQQVLGLLTGRIDSHLYEGTEVEITSTTTFAVGEKLSDAIPDTITVRISGYSWTLAGDVLALLR